MPRANEIKKGMVLNYNGKLLIVKNIDIQSPSARGAATLYKMRFSDVRTGLKVEERFKGDDIVDTVTLTRRFVDFSYVDGNEYVFMDKEDYTPYTFTKEQIEEELQFIPEGGMPDMQVLTGTASCWRWSCRRPLTWKLSKPRRVLKVRPPAPHQASHHEHRPGDSGAGIPDHR